MAKLKAVDFSSLSHYRLDQIRVTDRELGRGAYATVLELEYMGLKCAGKKIHDLLLILPGSDVTYTVRRFEEECHIISQVRHPNIVQFLGVYFQQKEQIPMLVMEFLPINLSSCIEQYYDILPKEISFSILHDVALGLRYLHSQTPPIIHRDLSSNNVLLTPNMTAKISDLGVARILNLDPNDCNMTRAPGTPTYMPPEVMKSSPKYNTSIDLFSYGILMIHVLSGNLPEPQVEPTLVAKGGKLVAVTEAERRAKFLQIIGSNHPLMDLVLKCINNNSQQRPQTSEIVGRLAEMVSQFPASFANRLEMLKRFQINEEEKKALREKVGEEFMRCEEKSLEVKQLQLLIDNLNTETSRLTTSNTMVQDELANKDAIISAKEEIIAATATIVARKESEVQSQNIALEQKGRVISGISDQLTRAREYLATKQQILQAGITWQACADLPTVFNGGHSVVINGEVYFGGGNTDERHEYNEYIVHCYKPPQNKWTTLPPLPVRYFGLGQINGKLVAVGGVRAKDKKPTGEVYTYDEKAQQWKQTIPPMQTARVSPGILSFESINALIIVGGEVKHNSYTNTVEIFKPLMSQWYKAYPLPTACSEISTVTIENICYILGGYKYPSNLKQALCISVEDLFRETESTEEETDQAILNNDSSGGWKALFESPVYIPAAAKLSGKLLAIGGDKTIEGGARTRKIYLYSPSADSWVYISDLPAPRSMTTVANLSSNEILVIGGEYGGNRVKTVYKGTLTMKA